VGVLFVDADSSQVFRDSRRKVNHVGLRFVSWSWRRAKLATGLRVEKHVQDPGNQPLSQREATWKRITAAAKQYKVELSEEDWRKLR
jgi:hypothetical protein